MEHKPHAHHTIHARHRHLGWNNTFQPVIRIASGDTVAIETNESSDGQIDRNTKAEDLTKLDFGRANVLSGPIWVEGAEPGDALKVTVLNFTPTGQGYTAIIPGFGLLADDFAKPAIHWWTYDPACKVPAAFGRHARVPLKPFAGTMGVAPAEAGQHSVIPPRRVGGNMDLRDIAAGTELYLPVEVKGALFSVGDTHAVQGDGEVCGTALESRLDVALRFEVIKGKAPRFPRVTTHGPVARHLDGKGYEIATGVGPDLMEAAKNAVRGMIDVLTAEHGLTPEDAYMLCSVCADLRISEIVDRPNWIVSLYFPRIVFD